VTAVELAPPVIAPPPPRSRTAAPHRAATSGSPPSPRPAAPAAALTPLTPLHDAEPSPATSAAPAAQNPDELAYDQAWEALRANNFTRAASGFSRVMLLAPDSALVEDASFWRAVALARGKRSAEARAAFHDFLDAYARSTRAGEANAMLGWLLIDARVYDEAERRFRAAAADRDPAARASAAAGLDALVKRKR
jgi:TolA-binding protein